MNCTFSLSHDNLVAETLWTGDLNYEIMSNGIVRQNQWIMQNSNRLPLVLVSNFTSASLNDITESDIQRIASQFQGGENLFPDMTWVAIMPKEVTFKVVRLWLEHAESMFTGLQVVKTRTQADAIIKDVLARFADE